MTREYKPRLVKSLSGQIQDTVVFSPESCLRGSEEGRKVNALRVSDPCRLEEVRTNAQGSTITLVAVGKLSTVKVIRSDRYFRSTKIDQTATPTGTGARRLHLSTRQWLHPATTPELPSGRGSVKQQMLPTSGSLCIICYNHIPVQDSTSRLTEKHAKLTVIL